MHFAPKEEVKEEKPKKKRGAKLKKGSSKFLQDGDDIIVEQVDPGHSRHSSIAKSDTSMIKAIEVNTLENEIAEMIGEKIIKEELGADADKIDKSQLNALMKSFSGNLGITMQKEGLKEKMKEQA